MVASNSGSNRPRILLLLVGRLDQRGLCCSWIWIASLQTWLSGSIRSTEANRWQSATVHIARSNATANEETAATSKKNSSSELSTCNYVARQCGIRKGMFLGDAIQMCPDLVVLPYDFDGFEEVSGIVSELLHGWAEQYNGCVETVSCDESYVEVNVAPDDCQGQEMHVFLNSLAELIRADIVKKTECTASIGIGPNKVSHFYCDTPCFVAHTSFLLTTVRFY